MIEQFKIKEHDYGKGFGGKTSYNKEYDGFLQFLGTISQHDEQRVAIHIPSKIWMFYKLNKMGGYRPVVWLCDHEGNYFVKSVFGNLYPITSKDAGRLMLDIDRVPAQFIGKVVEISIRYVKAKIENLGTRRVEAHSMTRKVD